jgi:hypothetical protein
MRRPPFNKFSRMDCRASGETARRAMVYTSSLPKRRHIMTDEAIISTLLALAAFATATQRRSKASDEPSRRILNASLTEKGLHRVPSAPNR